MTFKIVAIPPPEALTALRVNHDRYSNLQIGAQGINLRPQLNPASMLWQERIESIKAGLLGAIACVITAVAFSLLEAMLLPELHGFNGGESPASLISLLPWQSLGWAIASLTGFLFAVTYRYVIREDPSSHLRSGAVLAFGLVRGMAQVDAAWVLQEDWLLLIIMLGESLAMIAIARIVLDLGLAQGWLQPFKGFQ